MAHCDLIGELTKQMGLTEILGSFSLRLSGSVRACLAKEEGSWQTAKGMVAQHLSLGVEASASVS